MKRLIVTLLGLTAVFSSCGDNTTTDTTTTTAVSTTSTSSTTTTIEAKGPVICDVIIGVPADDCIAKVGDEVKITVTNPNASDEMHLHGYDLLSGEMAINTPTSISFTADQAGDFELESHVTDEVVMVLRVTE